MAGSELKKIDFDLADVGIGLLESITRGLYRDPGDVLREYISNEIDNSKAPTLVSIKTEPDTRSIVIQGDGPGMTWEQFRKAVRIGVSEKNPEKNIGFRGIGIWAGISACDELIIATKSDQDAKEYELHVDCKKLRSYYGTEHRNMSLIKVLIECAKYREFKSSRPHGTEVRLSGVIPDFKELLNEEYLLKYLQRECPVSFEEGFAHREQVEHFLKEKLPRYRRVKMKLNGGAILGLHAPPDVRKPIFGEIRTESADGKGEVLAYYWMCHGKYSMRIASGYDSGLRLRVKNFTVVHPDTIQTHMRRIEDTNYQFLDYWVGEVHAVHPDLRPNAERKDLESSIAKDELLRKLWGILQDFMVKYSRTVSKVGLLADAVEKALEVSTNVNAKKFATSQDVQEKIDLVQGQLETLQKREEDVDKAVSAKETLPGLEKLREQYQGHIRADLKRAMSHLTALGDKLEDARKAKAKVEKQAPKQASLGTATPTAASATAESKPDGARARREVSAGLNKAFEDAAGRIFTYESDAKRLAAALLQALYELGWIENKNDVSSVVNRLISITQRRR